MNVAPAPARPRAVRGPRSSGTGRLLTRAQARDYLGGRDPYELLPPALPDRCPLWDRKALDAALDRLSGLDGPQPGSLTAQRGESDAAEELEAARNRMRAARTG